MWPRWGEIVLGIYVAASPLIFQPSEPIFRYNDFACGAAIVALAAASFWQRLHWAHFLFIAVGGWMVAFAYLAVPAPAPAPAALQNDLLVALVLWMLAIIPSRASEQPPSWRRYFDAAP